MKYILTFLVLFFALPAHAQDTKKSAYERVIETNTLRCGYVVYPPAIIIDPNTGEFSGIIHDVMEQAADLLNIKIEWTEEVGWGNTVKAINSKRVDAICVGFWQNPAEGKFLGFTTPLWYSVVNAYVRADDMRFDNNIESFNKEEITISSGDGEMSEIIARQDFPMATILSKPNMSSVIEQMIDVQTGKADVTFVENYLFHDFLKSNPGSLRKVSGLSPIRVFGNTIAIPQDDVRLKSMLDSALIQILNSGQMDKILKKYENAPDAFYRVSKPYEVPQ